MRVPRSAWMSGHRVFLIEAVCGILVSYNRCFALVD